MAVLRGLHPQIMDISRAASEGYKIWILSGGMGLVILWRLFPQKVALRLLVLLTLVASLNYLRWGPKMATVTIDAYDLTHYYLNAKYFDELGYYDLYPACILADHDNGGPHFQEGHQYMAQNAAGHGMRPIDHALTRGEEVRERFSPERWGQFEHDLLYLQRESGAFTDKLWRQMIQDHGYNGTPAWTVVAKPLTQLVPVEAIKILGYADVALLGTGIGMVYWAFGTQAALWTWFFLMVSYSTRWPTITWAYLRYDYLVAMLAGMSLIKKGHYLWAGIATGWATAMRFFPLMWLYGPGMKGLIGLARRQINRKLVLLAAGTLLGVGVLQGLAVVALGPEPVTTHFENMLDHNSSQQLSSRRIGLALALPFNPQEILEPRTPPKYIEPERKETVEAQKPLRFAIAGLVMLLLGWALRNAKDEEAYAFGFVPFFLLTTASYYYYVTRVTLALMHAADLTKTRNQAGLAWLLGLELFTNWSETAHSGHRVYLIGTLAWGIFGYVVLMTGLFLHESNAKDREKTTDSAAA